MNSRIKLSAIILMAATFAAGMQTATAKGVSRKGNMQHPAQSKADTVVVYKTDTVYLSEDGTKELGEIAGIKNQYQVEAYRIKMEKDAEADKRNKDYSRERERGVVQDNRTRLYFNIILQSCILFCIGILLPVMIIFVHIHYTRMQQRRYEMLVDLIRDGVDIKPDMLDTLAVSRLKYNAIKGLGAMKGKMSADSYEYCVKRIAVSVAAVFMGIVLLVYADMGFFFVIAILVACILLMQAAIRYFSSRYISKNIDSDNTTVNPTTDDNAQ